MSTRVGVCLDRIGWHSWLGATGKRAYLRALHRHRFLITVELDVRHDDRDVEFHDLRDTICDWWGGEDDQRDRGSCEQIATQLLSHVDGYFSGRRPAVLISEDGEAWAKVEADQ